MSNPSRRGFLATATGALLVPVWINSALGDTADARVAKIVAENRLQRGLFIIGDGLAKCVHRGFGRVEVLLCVSGAQHAET